MTSRICLGFGARFLIINIYLAICSSQLQTTRKFNITAIMIYSLLLAFVPIALAAPAPVPVLAPALAIAPHPMITPPPSLLHRSARLQQRNIISDASADLAGLTSYVESLVGSFPSYIASGVPNFFQDFPTGSAVQKSLSLSDDDLAAIPTQVLNIPFVPPLRLAIEESLIQIQIIRELDRRRMEPTIQRKCLQATQYFGIQAE
jgi:hypothetical protein